MLQNLPTEPSQRPARTSCNHNNINGDRENGPARIWHAEHGLEEITHRYGVTWRDFTCASEVWFSGVE